MAFVVGPDSEPDKYRLRRQIGGGGEAELWEAEFDVGGGPEQVAIKILRTEHLQDLAYWRGRWAEQVDLLRLVQHPGVVGVHTQFEGPRMHRPGAAEQTPGRALYLVMNWVDGEDLRDWVARHTTPADRIAGLRILAQVADTLDYLHSSHATPSGRPIVHGDLSPANVIVDAAGQAVLVDFGLVRIARHVTTVGRGTTGYAAPEVLLRGEYSPASDRYAFGGVAYYLLTGAHPPADPNQLRAGLARVAAMAGAPTGPDELVRIFADDPAERPTAGEWIRLLRTHTSTVPVILAPPPTQLAPGAAPPRSGRPYARWLPVAVAAALVVAVASGTALGANLVRGGPEPAAEPPASVAAPGPPSTPAATAPTPTPPQPPSPTPAQETPDPADELADAERPEPPEPDPWPGEPLGEIFEAFTETVPGGGQTRNLDGGDSDVAGSREGLRAINGTVFFPWSGDAAPTLLDCRSIPEADRTLMIPFEHFEQTTFICVRTAGGRYGYVETRSVSFNSNQLPERYFFYCVIWKMPGDR